MAYSFDTVAEDYRASAARRPRALEEAEQLRRQLAITDRELESLTRELKAVTETRDALFSATGGVVPSFQRQGSFTICVLADPVSERVFTGAACCSATDTYNETIGHAISLGRAMQARADYYAATAFAR